jgi:hypothetical protein
MSRAMQILIARDGSMRCLYSDALPLHAFGTLNIARASCVEPDVQGQWFADLAPVQGPVLGPFTQRCGALQAEQQWLETHRLLPSA